MFICHDGWHVVGDPGELTYARVAVRLRDEHGTYIYRIGSVPDDKECRMIRCYGSFGGTRMLAVPRGLARCAVLARNGARPRH